MIGWAATAADRAAEGSRWRARSIATDTPNAESGSRSRRSDDAGLSARPRRPRAVPGRAGRLLRARDRHRHRRESPCRDFARQLVRRGFVCLSIGFDPRVIDPAKSGIRIQPLSYLAYVASNAYTAMANLPEVDASAIGVIGHSYGGKWAMFAACLDEQFACGVWSDPGIVFDETRPQRQLLGAVVSRLGAGRTRKPG